MNAPTLFDAVGSRPAEVTGSTETGHGRGVAAPPTARHSDPQTSHEAAAIVKPGNGALIYAIRLTVSINTMTFKSNQPMSAFDIADSLMSRDPRRWDEGTIRSAVSRAGLTVVDKHGRSNRGLPCQRYELREKP